MASKRQCERCTAEDQLAKIADYLMHRALSRALHSDKLQLPAPRSESIGSGNGFLLEAESMKEFVAAYRRRLRRSRGRSPN
jgi:hypothetical protein